MRELFSLIGAVALFVLFQATGLIALFSLSHPWWNTKASLIGCAIGIAIAVLLFWIGRNRPVVVKRLAVLFAALLPLCFAVTWYFAQKFINAADFEPLAGQIWHKGYITTVALFLPAATFFIRPLISGKQK